MKSISVFSMEINFARFEYMLYIVEESDVYRRIWVSLVDIDFNHYIHNAVWVSLVDNIT